MKKLNLFLLVAGFFVFSSCTERLEHNEEKSSGNVVINLSSVNAERGAVPDGYSSVDISQVKEWKLTFSPVSPYNDFPDEVRTIEKTINGTYSVTIGVGRYDLFVEGSYTELRDNGEFTYNLSGSCSGIVVEEGKKKTVPVLVLVGPRKTTEGKGSFSAEMSFMQGELYKYYYKTIGLSENTSTTDEKSKRFKAELVSRKTGKIVYSTHSVGNLLVAVADSKDSSVTVKSAQTESEQISSGYYYFRFYADFAPVKQNEPSAEITPVWKEVSIGDNLVEIGDGLLTSMSRTSLSFPDESTTYCYYASEVDGSEKNNGISWDAPGELYAVLDTIYNNPMVQNARVDYIYKDSIKFDVSKIGSGKIVEIICTKKGSQEGGSDTPSFTLNEDSSVLFNMHAESITLTSTGDAKSVKIKESSSAFVDSGNAQKAGISLEKGVYLDLTSLTTSESIKSVNLYLDVDDIEYYKKNPVFVSSVSLLENNAINNDYYDVVRFAGDGQFNFIFAEKKISSERFEYFADSPVLGVRYSHEAGKPGDSPYIFGLYNTTFDSTPVKISDNISVSAWCSDEDGNIYAAAFDVANEKPSKAPYFIKYEKQVKGASFNIEQKPLGYSVENLPASMCTDGKSIWYVNSAAKINPADGSSDSFSLFDAGSWVSSDSMVYKVSIKNPAAQEPLDFSALFNNGKVTAVYYCDGALYVAGFKSELQAKCKWAGYGENNETEHEIYNRTFSVYKLKEPDNIASATLVSGADVYTDASELERKGLKNEDVRVRSYSSITDMAVVGGKVYVLENTYMTKQSGRDYPTPMVYGTLRNITDNKIYKEYTYKEFDNSFNLLEKKADFVLPGKILAVVPKKLKLVLCDSEKGENYYYDVDLKDADNVLIERKDASSGYCFDSFPAGSDLTGKTMFNDNFVYIKQSSKDTLVSE